MKRFTLNKTKLKAVLHYVIDSCGNKSNVGKTVLFKILYFSDFDFYELHERSITGETYSRLPFGPAPRNFEGIATELEKEGKIEEVKVEFVGHKQIKYISKVKPDISKLDAEEIKLIDDTIRKISSMNATQVTAYSHEDMPWKSAKDHENLDYEMVFYRDDSHAVRDYNDIQ